MATEASPTPQRAAVPFPTMDYNSTIEYYKHLMSENTVSPSVQQQHDSGAMTDADYQTYLNGLRQANESYEYAIKQLESSANYLKDYSKYLNSTTPPAANAPSTSNNNNNGGGGSTTINVAGSKSSGMSTASIIGIVLGVVATVALLAGVFIFYKRRPTVRQPAAYSKDDDDDKTLDDMTHGTTAYTGASLKSPVFTSQELGVDEELIAVRVPLDKIERGPLIARGGFGEVYRGMFRGQPVAIKSLLSHKRKDVAMIKLFMAEIKFMSTIDHPRVVQFLGVAWESLSDLCVLTEFMNGGDLYTTLSNWDSAEPPRPRGFDPEKVKIGLHVAHALTYMHSLQPVVLHRDLKSRNILLDRQLNAKLTDFGIAREQIDKTMTAGVGSSLWMAPEVMMGQRYNEKADVFSFGVVLSELDTQQLPYSDALEDGTGRQLPQTAILQLVSMGRITIQLSDRALSRFPELYDLARECVSMDPHARPSAAETLHRLNSVWKRVGDPHGFF